MKYGAKGRAPRRAQVYLGLGSNMGEKEAHLRRAVEWLLRLPDTGDWVFSRIYKTPPVGPVEQDWFLNMVAGMRTELLPVDLMRRCLRIEKRLGRVRKERWGPRTIDIDILMYDDVVIRTPELEVPHPRMLERSFVLAPLAELAPDLEIGGKTVQAHLEAVGTEGVTVWGEFEPPEAEDSPARPESSGPRR